MGDVLVLLVNSLWEAQREFWDRLCELVVDKSPFLGARLTD